MRIVGGRDFYDNAMSFGIDKTHVFVRNQSNIVVNEKIGIPLINPARGGNGIIFETDKNEHRLYTHSAEYRFKTIEYRFHAISVWLAGKYYGGLKCVRSEWQKITGTIFPDIYFWDEDSFQQFIKNHGRTVRAKQVFYDRNQTSPLNRVSDLFNRQIKQTELDWLISNKVTIATYVEKHEYYDETGRAVSSNETPWTFDGDNLKKLQFYKRKNPVDTFQEIDQWISGTLPSAGKPMVQIQDDKVKAHKHGFDKWSFRKQPQGYK